MYIAFWDQQKNFTGSSTLMISSSKLHDGFGFILINVTCNKIYVMYLLLPNFQDLDPKDQHIRDVKNGVVRFLTFFQKYLEI